MINSNQLNLYNPPAKPKPRNRVRLYSDVSYIPDNSNTSKRDLKSRPNLFRLSRGGYNIRNETRPDDRRFQRWSVDRSVLARAGAGEAYRCML